MALKSEVKERQRVEALQYDVRTCSLVSGFGDREGALSQETLRAYGSWKGQSSSASCGDSKKEGSFTGTSLTFADFPYRSVE